MMLFGIGIACIGFVVFVLYVVPRLVFYVDDEFESVEQHGNAMRALKPERGAR